MSRSHLASDHEVMAEDGGIAAKTGEGFPLRWVPRSLPLAFGVTTFLFPLLTFAITYPVSLSTDGTSYPYLFLSATLDHAPASCIGGFGLSLSVFSLAVCCLLRYGTVKWAIANAAPTGRRMGIPICGKLRFIQNAGRANNFGFLFGLLASVGALGVAAFQYHHMPYAHLTFAAIFFLCGGAYCFNTLMIDFIVPTTTPAERRVRCVLVMLLACVLPAAGIGHLLTIADKMSLDSFIFAMSILEITTLVLYSCFLATFIPSFRALELTITFGVSAERQELLAKRDPRQQHFLENVSRGSGVGEPCRVEI